MRRVVAHQILTLDGVAVFDAVLDTIVELRDTPDILDEFFAKVAQEDAMLLGRVTYEYWADYWPTSTNEPFAGHINRVPKYVASRTLDNVAWGPHDNATLIQGDLAAAVTALKREPGLAIGVHGSPTLVEWLLHEGLLDELRLEVYPVIAGSGRRLFHNDRPPRRLDLAASRTTQNGVALLSYRTTG